MGLQSNALNQTDKTSVYLVRFQYGDSSELLLTDAGENQYTALSADPFLADARLEVNIPSLTGGLSEPPITIRFSKDLAIFGREITSGKAFPRTRVKVWELVDGFEQAKFQQKLRYVFTGWASRASRNPAGYPDAVEIEAISAKNALDFPAGFQANAECGNTFGRGGCSVDVEALREEGEITTINRNLVTITGLSVHAEKRYWQKGWVKRDGLEIQIRSWGGGTFFDLGQLPPDSWRDAVASFSCDVTVVPGCDLLRKTCRDVWDNEQDFNGLALATPPYNPITENPEQ